MIASKYNIQLKDSLIEPDKIRFHTSSKAFYRKSSRSTKTLYKVWLYLDGKDVPFVKKVKYILHDSFKNPEQVVERTSANQNCQFAIWTWGIFTVKAEIEDVKGRIYKLEHRLTYGNKMKSSNIRWTHIK